MIKVFENEYKKDEVLSSLNFIKFSDIIFSASLSNEDLESLNLNNINIIETNNEFVTFVNLEFNLKENSVIYSHTDYIEGLFEVLKDIKFKNIKLITSQSDRKITKKLFAQKPDCISQWYGVNVCYKNKDLIAIPLGLAPYRNTKSVIIEDFTKYDFQHSKKEFLYVNFNKNTNYFHREKAVNLSKRKLKINLTESRDYVDYLNNLSCYRYALAPWGNGIDTHRFWEALYSGTIPVTKKHSIYESFKNLPMVLLSSYNSIDTLDKYLDFNSFDLSKLDINWWKNIIQENRIDSELKEKKVQLSSVQINFMSQQINILRRRNEIRKKITTYLRRFDTKFNIFRRI